MKVTEQELKEAAVAPRVTQEQIDALVDQLEYKTHVFEGTTSTVVLASLNGFVLGIGHSACVSLANLNRDIGERISKEDAKSQAKKKLWELEGYALKKSLEN